MKRKPQQNADAVLDIDPKTLIEAIRIGLEVQHHAYHGQQAIETQIGRTTELEAQHVEGAIRGYLKNHPTLFREVEVFPVFCAQTVHQLAIESISDKMKVSPLFAAYLPESSPLPEATTLSEQDREQRARQEAIRNQPERLLNKIAVDALHESNITPATLFHYFLQACFHSPVFHFSQRGFYGLAFPFWIIPLRNQSHYSLLMVRFLNGVKELQYYSSDGTTLPEDIEKGMVSFLTSKIPHNLKINKINLSRREQRGESFNCGVFVFHRAIEEVCLRLGAPSPFKEWIQRGETEHDFHYRKVFLSLRQQMAEFLKKEEQNITLLDDLSLSDHALAHTTLLPSFAKPKSLKKLFWNLSLAVLILAGIVSLNYLAWLPLGFLYQYAWQPIAETVFFHPILTLLMTSSLFFLAQKRIAAQNNKPSEDEDDLSFNSLKRLNQLELIPNRTFTPNAQQVLRSSEARLHLDLLDEKEKSDPRPAP